MTAQPGWHNWPDESLHFIAERNDRIRELEAEVQALRADGGTHIEYRIARRRRGWPPREWEGIFQNDQHAYREGSVPALQRYCDTMNARQDRDEYRIQSRRVRTQCTEWV